MDLDDLAKLIGQRYLSRSEPYAKQLDNGSYNPVNKRLSMGPLRDHLRGDQSLGHYLVSPEGQVKLFAYDIDLDSVGTWEDAPLCERPACAKRPAHNVHPREVWQEANSELYGVYRRQLRALAEGLAERAARVLSPLTVAVAYSGSKGTHVYGFTGLADAGDARAAAHWLLESHTYHQVKGDAFWKHDAEFPHLTVEVFPKQDVVASDGGVGNLMRLPLGRNRKGGEAYFIDPTKPLDEWSPMDPAVALTEGTVLHHG